MPVRVGDLQSFVGTHDITYVATDDTPGSPGPIYARHALVYDLFLTTEEPAPGQNISIGQNYHQFRRMGGDVTGA